MRKQKVEIHFFLLVLMIILMNLLLSCSITRKVDKEKTEVNTEKTTDETTKTISDITTQTKEQISSVTNISENCDTVVSVEILPTGDKRLDEFLKNNPLKVPVKFNRTTQKQEYTNRQENKKENIQVAQQKKQQDKQQVVTQTKKIYKKSRPSLVFWLIGGGALLLIGFFVYRSGILQKLFILFKPKK